MIKKLFRHQLKLKTKLQLYFCLIGMFSVTLTSIIVYSNSRNTLEKISFERLTSIREVKKRFIENYFDQLKNYIQMLSRNGDLINGLKNINHSESGFDFGLINASAEFNINDIIIISTPEEKILYSVKHQTDTNKSGKGINVLSMGVHNSYLSALKNSDHDIYINDFKVYSEDEKPVAYISTLIKEGETTLGVIIFEINADQINQIMTNNNNWREIGFGETAETYIVGPDFKMRTDSRFFIQEPEKYFEVLKKIGTQKDIIDKIRKESTSILLQEVKTTASVEGVQGLSGTNIITDYRGINVISAYSPLKINNLNWIIISEIDTSEAFEAIYSLKEYLILASLVIMLLAASLGVVISRNISKPISSLTKAAENFGKGNLEYSTEINTDDELGLLYSTFNTMIEKIIAHTDELKLEIEDRKRISDELIQSREQLRNLSSHLQSVREEERKLIAREIHDELGQSLNTLKLKLSLMKRSIGNQDENNFQSFSEIFALIDNTINTIRKIITELRPQLLDDLGLTAAIEWQVKEFSKNSGIDCTFDMISGDYKINSDRAIAIFRILQEGLTNIARHSKATRVDISLKEENASIELVIKDNGIGIPENKLTYSKSFGLMGMKERAYYLGGDVVFQSREDLGTTILLTIPQTEGKI